MIFFSLDFHFLVFPWNIFPIFQNNFPSFPQKKFFMKKNSRKIKFSKNLLIQTTWGSKVLMFMNLMDEKSSQEYEN